MAACPSLPTARAAGGRAPTYDDLPHLPYLAAVVKEALRLYPAIPVFPRCAAAADVLPSGHRILEGGWRSGRSAALLSRFCILHMCRQLVCPHLARPSINRTPPMPPPRQATSCSCPPTPCTARPPSGRTPCASTLSGEQGGVQPVDPSCHASFTLCCVLHSCTGSCCNKCCTPPPAPCRFLGEREAALHRFQWLPFGAGPRMCLGATFAQVGAGRGRRLGSSRPPWAAPALHAWSRVHAPAPSLVH